MKNLAKQLGMKEIPGVEEVIIKTEKKDIVIKNPVVSQMNAMGQISFQVVGNPTEVEREDELKINEEDIEIVAEKTGKTKKEAETALLKSKGDIAEAIILLKN